MSNTNALTESETKMIVAISDALRAKLTNPADPAPLYELYDGQYRPEKACVTICLGSGKLDVDTASPGGGTTMDIYHGTTRTYYVPSEVHGPALLAWLEEILPTLQRILDHSIVEWNGSNNVGELDHIARELEEELDESARGLDCVEMYNASEMDLSQWEIDCAKSGEDNARRIISSLASLGGVPIVVDSESALAANVERWCLGERD